MSDPDTWVTDRLLDASISANTLLPLPSGGRFVGMLFHNAAQAVFLAATIRLKFNE